ncbi:MAG: IPT/TIG domain-containing protein [Thermoleophilia bacterium]|nr:IPT/TIG domain-containing protein [Thermoleophilia bacterium]
MRGRRRWARGRASVALLLTALVVLFVVLGSGSALASPPWPDAPNAWWITTYGVTEGQAATVADGRADGKFYPNDDVTRAQFAKMAVDGTGGTTYTPLIPSFLDVPATNYFYPWIEGGVRDGLISGYGNQTFGPNNNIIRQQANSILGTYLAQRELNVRGHIAGEQDNYPSLNTWYLAEGMTLLGGFVDAARVATVHAPTTAYLIYKGVVQGTAGAGGMYLGPNNNLSRAQAVALILRVKAVQFATAVPTVALLNPSGGAVAGGNNVVITGANFVDVTKVMFGTKSVTFTVNSATQITAVAPAGTAGVTVDVTVITPAGTSAVSAASKYTYGTPTVTALDPDSGPSAGGNQVVITGTLFNGATAVKFGGANAKSFVVNSSTRITAVAPAGTRGATVDVTVTTPAGTSPTTGTANDYTYGIPTVTSITPNTGPHTGGTWVTIKGTDFTNGTVVNFGSGGYYGTNVTIDGFTTITCRTPAHAPGTVDVIVVNQVGASSAAGTANDFTYFGPPTKLVMVTQPGNVENGRVFAVAPAVRLQDAAGRDALVSGVPVEVSIYSGTGVLTGTTLVVTDANGIATFSNLKINGTPGYFRLKFDAGGLTPVISNSFKLTDLLGPILTVTGATANGTPLTGSLTAGYTLKTNGDAGTDYLVQFAAGTITNETLQDTYFGLKFVPSLSSVSTLTLQGYYDARGVPEPYLAYLKSAAAGGASDKPFVYIKGSTVKLVDAAKHDLASTDVDMTIPGDFPEGTYVVRGTIKDTAGNSTTVTLKLIIQHVAPTVTMGAIPAVIVEGTGQAVNVTVTGGLPGAPVHLEVARTEPAAATTYLTALLNLSGQAVINIPAGDTGWGNLNLRAFYTGTANPADARLGQSAQVSLYCARTSGISMAWTDAQNVTLPAGLGAGATGPVQLHPATYNSAVAPSTGAYDNSAASPLVLDAPGIPTGTLVWYNFTASTNADGAPNWVADTSSF